MHCMYYKVSFLQVLVLPVHGLSMLFKSWKGFCQMLCGNENFSSAVLLLLHCNFLKLLTYCIPLLFVVFGTFSDINATSFYRTQVRIASLT